MGLNRRELFATAGAAGAFIALSRDASAEQQYASRVAQIQQMRAANDSYSGLHNQMFKIRILNKNTWPLRFGLFGLRSNMQYRADVPGNNGTHQTGREINGGHRIAVVWDEFTEAVLDYVDVIVNHDVTFTIEQDGRLTV